MSSLNYGKHYVLLKYDHISNEFFIDLQYFANFVQSGNLAVVCTNKPINQTLLLGLRTWYIKAFVKQPFK